MKKSDYKMFNQIIRAFGKINIEKEDEENSSLGKIKLEPQIIYDKYSNKLKLEVKVGEEQLYRVKSLPEFYTRFLSREKYKYGSKLEFVHEEKAFEEDSKDILKYVLKYAEIIKYANETSNGYEYYTKRLGEDAILISNTGMDELFEALKNKVVMMEQENDNKFVKFIPEEPEIKFELIKQSAKEYSISTKIDIYDYKLFEGNKYCYILLENKLYRCSKEYEQTIIRLLEIFRKNFTKKILFSKEQLSEFFSVVEPHLKSNIKIKEADYKEIINYIPAELYAKMFLDYDENHNILADIRFIYDDVEINPLNIDEKQPVVPRNAVKEAKLIDMLLKTGFMYDQKNSRLVLADEAQIYNFLSEEIEKYMKNFDVLATEK